THQNGFSLIVLMMGQQHMLQANKMRQFSQTLIAGITCGRFHAIRAETAGLHLDPQAMAGSLQTRSQVMHMRLPLIGNGLQAVMDMKKMKCDFAAAGPKMGMYRQHCRVRTTT